MDEIRGRFWKDFFLAAVLHAWQASGGPRGLWRTIVALLYQSATTDANHLEIYFYRGHIK
jgi:hypothetical protein